MKNKIWLIGGENLEFIVTLFPKNIIYEFLRKYVGRDKLSVSFFIFLD